MHSSLISKIEKARVYAGERERVSITSLAGSFRGNHNEYQVSFDGGTWDCTCPFFASNSLCSHTMAMKRILDGMLPKDVREEAEIGDGVPRVS